VTAQALFIMSFYYEDKIDLTLNMSIKG